MPEILGISADVSNLLKGLLAKDPSTRLSMNDCIWKFPFIKE